MLPVLPFVICWFHGVRRLRPGALLVLALAAWRLPAAAIEPVAADLVVVGAPAARAELLAVDRDGSWRFRDAAGEAISLPPDRLVRWSTLPLRQPAELVQLADGSRLRLAAGWGDDAPLSMDAATVRIKSPLLGTLELPRPQIRAVYWRLPADGVARQARIDRLQAAQAASPDADAILLDNDDVLTGAITRIGPPARADGVDQSAPVAAIDGPLGAIEAPMARLRGVALARAGEHVAAGATHLLTVGLRDGSLIAATSAHGDGESQIMLRSVALGERSVALKDVVCLQAHGGHVAYLSDLEPVAFRHRPYLDVKQPFTNDRNFLGGAPTVGGRTFLKSVGMPAASRLTYPLAGTFARFAASVAIDDAAGGRGSVVCRVLLLTGGAWREAFVSGVVRGGDPPVEVAVDLAGAERIALVVDYADRGDECDDAVWLDARLEAPVP